MGLTSANQHIDIQARLAELEHRNQLLQAEVERLSIYKDFAYTDVLTEIPNRRFYYERLLQEVARTRRGGHPLTLALVDLDFFKQINDQVGHRSGDQVLKFFSQFLRVNLRQEDILCRIGGDEFAIIMPDTPAERAVLYFERVKAKFERVELSVDERASVNISFSCGIASFAPDFTPEDFIEQADHALYSAKACGRNRVVAAGFGKHAVSKFVN